MSKSTSAGSNRRRVSGSRAARRGPRKLKHHPAEPASVLPDYPYTIRLKDGRTVFVEIPGKWLTKDRSGQIGFLAPAMRFLDKLRALSLSPYDRPPTPGYLAALRLALGLTQQEFARKVGVDKMSVSRWERGTAKPGHDAVQAVEKLRKEVIRKGVTI